MKEQSLFKRGDKVIVFDADTWMKKGDIGDNSCFYLPAIVTHVRKDVIFPYEWLADVEFNDGRFSRGHFQKYIQQHKNIETNQLN